MSIKEFFKNVIKTINPKAYVFVSYRKRFGFFPDLKNPKNFNEKILWLIFNWQHPLIVQCSDKYRMRDYVDKCGLVNILPELYGAWEDANLINWESLPDSFVIKCNHGCKMNLICSGSKSEFDIEAATSILDRWMHINYGGKVYEPHYSKIKPIIFAEEYIDTGIKMPIDYKIYCFNGVPSLVLACVERETTVHLEWYDFDWNVLDIGAEKNQKKAPKPMSLDKMVEYAKKLSKPFPYVRVDFYERDGQPILGELTFTPYFGMAPYYSEKGNRWLGNKLILPEKYLKHFE